MAIASQPQFDDTSDPKDLYNPGRGHTLPGHTVDALLAEGKVEEAREELERLLQAGIKSGEGLPMNEALMQQIMAEARARAGRTTR